MKTALIPSQEIGQLDAQILNKLELHSFEMRAVTREKMIIGIRNEQREIYRVIGVTGLALFLNTIRQLVSLNLVDELEAATDPKNGFDAIFCPH